MNHAGDAAEQVVRMSLEGAEVALKITGVAAKNLAAALYTILKDQKKTNCLPNYCIYKACLLKTALFIILRSALHR